MNYTAADKYIRDRLTIPTELSSKGISEALAARVRAQCFFSARVCEARVLELLRAISDQYSQGELGLAEARSRLERWMDRENVGEGPAPKVTNIASSMRLDLILRQNAAMAAATGRYQVSRDPDVEERWPCWRYIAGHNPRPAHTALDGMIFKKSDPFWNNHFPPWDFNCNCDVEDCDDPAQTPPPDRPEDHETGYAFHPEDAFRTSDLSSLEAADLREQIRQQMEDYAAEHEADIIIE